MPVPPVRRSALATSVPRRAIRARAASAPSTPPAVVAPGAGGEAEDALTAALAEARALGHEAEVEEIVRAAGVTLADVRGPVRRRDLVEVRRGGGRAPPSRGAPLPRIGRARQ